MESTGLCRLAIIGGLGRPFMHSIDLGDSDHGFHRQLASMFLYVAEKQSFDELWPNQAREATLSMLSSSADRGWSREDLYRRGFAG